MAHNITDRDGLFVVREPAWHGLGVVLPDYPSRDDAQKLAHPWEPVSTPVYRKVIRMRTHLHSSLCGSGDESRPFCEITEEPTESFEVIEDAAENVRSDGKGFLGVVSSTYTPVSNGAMYDIAEALEGLDRGSVRFETGGSLKGGRKVFLLLRLAEPLHVTGDPNGAVIPYYALQNSHDGGGAFRGQATVTRIVCDNTAQAADLDAAARGTEFTFSHTKNVGQRVEEAKAALAGWRTAITAFQDQAAYLMQLGIDVNQRELFLERFIPAPPDQVVSDRVMNNIKDARERVRALLAGPTCEGIADNAYGLVQASVEYLNHERRANGRESRFKRAYLDRSEVTSHAVKLVLEVAGA